MHRLSILLAEDMPHERLVIETSLREALPENVEPRFTVTEHAEAAVDLAARGRFDIVVLDIDFSHSDKSKGMTGLEAAKLIRARHPNIYIVVVSSSEEEATMAAAVEAYGVDWYLRRSSISFEELAWLARQALLSRLHAEGLLVEGRYRFRTESPAAGKILRRVDAILPHQNTLIYGETGTGKELIARRIHANARAFSPKRPLRVLDCSAISPTLFEGEIFGYKKGAFTGAVSDRVGILQTVNGGDLFLDEIHNIPLSLQQKLLRVLNDGVFSPLGSNEECRSKFRIIAAMNVPVERALKEGKILPDFLERIRKIRVELLPLRDRPEDIPLFVREHVGSLGLVDKEFTADAINLMKALPWRGNIRELKSFIDTVISEVKIPIIGRHHIEQIINTSACKSPAGEASIVSDDPFQGMAEKLLTADCPLPEALERLERAYYSKALENLQSVEQVARKSKLSRATLYRRLRELGLARL